MTTTYSWRNALTLIFLGFSISSYIIVTRNSFTPNIPNLASPIPLRGGMGLARIEMKNVTIPRPHVNSASLVNTTGWDPRLVLPPIQHPPVKGAGTHGPLYKYPKFALMKLQGRCPNRRKPINPYQVGRGNITEAFCARMHFCESRDLPSTALASPPGSGNTWTRHLIHQLTGLWTGAIYNDGHLRQGGFLGEGRQDRTVVAVKTHSSWQCGSQAWSCYDRAILIVRDPYEAVLAEFNRIISGHTGTPQESVFNTTRWQEGSINLAKHWFQTIELWTRFGNYKDLNGCLLLLSYARLKTHLREELASLGQFLGVNETFLQGPHMDCVVAHATGKFKRKKKLSWQKLFSDETKKTIEIYKERVNAILKFLHAGFSV